MSQSMDVLVTGGTGYVGRHLVPSLLKRGHRWPLILLPFYKLAEAIPLTATAAMRLGLVTIEQMVNALVYAVDHPPSQGERRIIDVPLIRRGRW